MHELIKSYSWEKPFLAVQVGMDKLMVQLERLPGIVQLLLFPIVLAVSLLNIPFVLVHWLILTVVEYFNPREMPLLSRGELLEYANELHTRWISRHRAMLECNPKEVADDIALPVIKTLADLIQEFGKDNFDHGRVAQIAIQLTELPSRTSPNAHLLGKFIHHFLHPDRVEYFDARAPIAVHSEAKQPKCSADHNGDQ